jgi:hypothetical protein
MVEIEHVSQRLSQDENIEPDSARLVTENIQLGVASGDDRQHAP